MCALISTCSPAQRPFAIRLKIDFQAIRKIDRFLSGTTMGLWPALLSSPPTLTPLISPTISTKLVQALVHDWSPHEGAPRTQVEPNSVQLLYFVLHRF